MRNLLKIIPILLLIGCGGGSSSSTIIDDTNPTEIYEISMELYKPYVVTTGDKVVKRTEDAHIKIIHIESESHSTVELIDGEANLIYLTPIIIENNSTKEESEEKDRENSIF